MNHNDGEYKPSVLIVNDDEAIKILEEERVEVAFLDFRLGSEDGLTVAKMLKKINESLKVIIITGFPSHHTAVEAMKSGMFDYLSKGESDEKILETLNKAVRSREMEILKKGKASPRKSSLKFIVICNHSLIKERLENFSLNYLDFKLMKNNE